MRFLSSPRLSLACAIFNSAFAVGALMDGSLGWAAICTAFAVFCFSNYLKSR
jgi:hypothetical protein